MGRLPTFCFSGAKVTPKAEEIARLRTAAERVASGYGLEIFDIQLRREPIGMVLRVVIDRRDAGRVETIEESVGIEDCQRVSHDLSAILDVEDEFGEEALGDKYTLEVSSPGLDRPLRHEADYRRFAGRLAKVVVSEAVDNQKAFEGRLRGLESGEVLLEGPNGRMHRLPLRLITRGKLEVEF